MTHVNRHSVSPQLGIPLATMSVYQLVVPVAGFV